MRPSAPVLMILAAGLLAPLHVNADTMSDDFKQPLDPARWEIIGPHPQVLREGGLKFTLRDGESVEIRLKRDFTDVFDVRMEYDVPEIVPNLVVGMRLTNEERKRRVDLFCRHTKEGIGEDRFVEYGRSEFTNYHDGNPIHTRGGTVKGRIGGLRLVKDGPVEMFAFQKNEGGGWSGPFDYPWGPMKFDCREYRLSLHIVAPQKAKPFDVILRKFTAWDSLYRAPDRKAEEGPYCRASDETMKDPKIWRFDFGPVGQQLEKLHIPVSQFTSYDQRRGWGWDTTLEPLWDMYKTPLLANEEAVKFGLRPSPNLHYWRGHSDMAIAHARAFKKRYICSVSHGGDYVSFFKRWMDLKIPCERDMVYGKRPYGFPLDVHHEADQWEERAAHYVDDDLATEFWVDLPDDRYTLMVGIGYTEAGPGGGSEFSIDAEGRPVKRNLGNNWSRCNMFQLDDVEVADGRLNVRLYANRRLAMNKLEPWDLGVSWMINYLVIIPSEEKDLIKAEKWRIIEDRGRKVRQVTFVPGAPPTSRILGNYWVMDEKPFFPVIWQAYHDETEHGSYPYYLWGNCMGTIGVDHQFKASQHFMQHDWLALSAADDYPWRTINALNNAHTWGHTTLLRLEALMSFVPQAIAGEGGALEDSRGRANRWDVQPPLNSRLHREIQKEAYTMVSQQLKLHPTISGHYLYEEYWHPRGQGYDHNSLNQFHIWLSEKYRTIEALNAEWGTNYASFFEIKPPGDAANSACWANFRRFRMYSQEQSVHYPCTLLEEMEPERVTYGCKGDYPTSTWYYANDIKVFGWYSPNHPRGASYHFGRVPMAGGYLFGCRYVYLDGRKQLDHKPTGPRRYLGSGDDFVYNFFMKNTLDGACGVRNEEYNDGIQHMFHRTRHIATHGKAGLIRHWTGQVGMYDDEAYVGPDVVVHPGALQFTRFMGWAYRAAPLLLPAKVPAPRVAILSTDASYYEIEGTGQLFSSREMERLLKEINVPVDILRDGRFDDLDSYQVVILGEFCSMIEPKQAARLKDFVRKGGRLLIMAGGARFDGLRLTPQEKVPGLGFAELAGCEIKSAKDLKVPNEQPIALMPSPLTPGITGEVVIGKTGQYTQALVPQNGCTILAKTGETPMAVASADGAVVTVAFDVAPAVWQDVWDDAQKSRWSVCQTFFRDILLSHWGVDRGFDIVGMKHPSDIEFGIRSTKDYALFAVMNNHRTDTEDVTVKLSLPDGRWELVNFTGERPLIEIRPDGGNFLKPDPQNRYIQVFASDIGSGALKNEGVKLSVPPLQAVVVMARRAREKVHVDAHDYTLRRRCGTPVCVVVGDEAPAGETKAAQRIVDFLKSREVPVEMLRASQVKVAKQTHEVRVDPRDGRKIEGQPVPERDWFLLQTFVNYPIETDRHMIFVGSEDTNRIVRHLGAVDTFTYDKVLEKVTNTYPGAGRGVIQTVDSINYPFYFANSWTFDGILVGGSDAAGTDAAVSKFLDLIKDMPKYVPPEIEEKMEIDNRPAEER